HITAIVEELSDLSPAGVEVEALMRTVQAQIEQYVANGAPVPPEAAVAARNISEPGLLADMVAYSPDMSTEQRQELLETVDVVERLKLVSTFLARQVESLELKGRIQNEVKSEMDKTQREYILREQLKAIQRELGEDDPQQAEINELRDKVEAAGMPEEIKTRAIKEIDRMSRIPSASPEVGVIRTYVDWLVGLPWNVSSEDLLDIKEAAKILDEDHYGLEKIKERILEYLAVRTLADTIRSPILAFVGPPGVGKTSLGKSIARAMGRKFVRMSLGGIHDEAEIRGHRRTYIGALPGRIIQNIKTAGTNNPVFMLDEVDKIGMDFRGDPSSALLEVLDPEQNNTFQDNYLEVPFDLRKVLFIATGNLLDPIPAALRDRMEVIQLPGYTQKEKVGIARRFLIPKQMENHGLKPKHIDITDEALLEIVQAYTHEAGVRNIEREIANIMRKVARTVAEGRKRKTIVNIKKLDEYLGPPRFEYGELEPEDQVGSATGLVVTEVGGDVVAIEVTIMEGKEDFILTGQLGEVMRESARAALSWIRSHASALGIEREVFEKNTLHIHVPAGATPKDGPSAGITMATAMVSAFTGIPVRKDVAMTGEITLRGRVLPIGGLKQKILAAHLSGAKVVIIPRKNEKDLRDIPDEIRKQIKIIPVDSSEQALDAALRRKPVPLAPKPPVATKLEPAPKEEPVEPSGHVRRPPFPPADQPPAIVMPDRPTGLHGGRTRSAS
ncbi:MAG TPA: endopeptidase La, partial [Candidatus Limnocylindrales bacterium]